MAQNSGYAYRSVVAPHDADLALPVYLAKRFSHSTLETWMARVEGGEVHVEGRVGGRFDKTRTGNEIVWQRPPWNEPDVPKNFRFVYRDEHVLAIDKPRGLPTLPNGGYLDNTLQFLIRREVKNASALHRLGRGTSGLVLFAVSDLARRTLSAAWRRQEVEKVYRARVVGSPEKDAFICEERIGPIEHPRLGRLFAASPQGRPARSLVRVLDLGPDSSLVEVSIETGRPHQIRIHLAASGHPLVNDPLYGAGGLPSSTRALPGDGGYWLHAHRLSFTHPATGRRTKIESPPPPELEASRLSRR